VNHLAGHLVLDTHSLTHFQPACFVRVFTSFGGKVCELCFALLTSLLNFDDVAAKNPGSRTVHRLGLAVIFLAKQGREGALIHDSIASYNISCVISLVQN
jgi:hypothetical protein